MLAQSLCVVLYYLEARVFCKDVGMLHTFSFQSMFGRDFGAGGVKRMCKGVKCCLSGEPVRHNTWLAIVRTDGKWGFCLPEHVNGQNTCVPTRKVVETLVPGLSSMKFTVPHRFSTGARKRKRTNAAAGV